MESVTYVCYNADELAAQSKDILTEIQNMKTALLKVAENDTNAGTLEEIKALLGMTEDASASAVSQTVKSADSAPKTATPTTDTKTEGNTVTEPSASAETHTNANANGAPNTVTVQPGDTLQAIAEKTGTNPRHLIDMNMLMEPVVLRPGQSLKF